MLAKRIIPCLDVNAGRVVKGGKRIIVTTAEVVHVDDAGKTSPCALMQQTLVPVPKTY